MTRSCHNHRTGGEKVGSTTNYYSKVSNEHTYTGKMTYSQGQVSDKSLHERKSSKKIQIHLFVTQTFFYKNTSSGMFDFEDNINKLVFCIKSNKFSGRQSSLNWG